MPADPPAPDPATRYRVGRKLGRTLYDHDNVFGMVDTPEQAATIVDALNARQPLAEAIRDAVEEIRQQYVHDQQAAYKAACAHLADNLNDTTGWTWTCENADELAIDREAVMALIFRLKEQIVEHGRPLSRSVVRALTERGQQ